MGAGNNASSVDAPAARLFAFVSQWRRTIAQRPWTMERFQ